MIKTPIRLLQEWGAGQTSIKASDMNSLIAKAQELDRRQPKIRPIQHKIRGKVTCCGPLGAGPQPQREDHTYWIEIYSFCSNDGTELEEPVEFTIIPDEMPDEEPNPRYAIILATNLAEMQIGTHYLTDGQDVEVDCVPDTGDPPRPRWVFTMPAPVILACVAGAHNAIASQTAIGMKCLYANRWTPDFLHDPSYKLSATHRGFAKFQDEWYTVGAFVIDPGLIGDYPCRVMKWNPVNHTWGEPHSSLQAVLSTGFMNILVWDDGSGERLIVGGESSAGTDIWSFDGTTWTPLTNQPVGYPNKLYVWDDGTGGGDELYAGLNLTSPGMQKLPTFGGSWSSLPTLPGYATSTPTIYDIKGWDEPILGNRLWITGHFGHTTPPPGHILRTVTRWDPVSNVYEPTGFLGGTADYGLALELYNDGTYETMYVGGVPFYNISPLWRWNGNSWEPKATQLVDVMGGGLPGVINALKVHGGKLIIGGEFHIRRKPVGLSALGQIGVLNRSTPAIDSLGEGFRQ